MQTSLNGLAMMSIHWDIHLDVDEIIKLCVIKYVDQI